MLGKVGPAFYQPHAQLVSARIRIVPPAADVIFIVGGDGVAGDKGVFSRAAVVVGFDRAAGAVAPEFHERIRHGAAIGGRARLGNRNHVANFKIADPVPIVVAAARGRYRSADSHMIQVARIGGKVVDRVVGRRQGIIRLDFGREGLNGGVVEADAGLAACGP